MSSLGQIIAIEKGVKSRTYSEVTTLHQECQKPALFNGMSKTYRSIDTLGEQFPPESMRVQRTAAEVLHRVEVALVELFDVTAAKDFANCSASADVVVEGQTLIPQAPVPFLLFLEKQLTDLRTFIEKLPTLDENETWTFDSNDDLHKTKEISTHRTKKLQKPVVLYDATKEHPAQTQLITEDVLIGYWDTVKQSGALPPTMVRQMLSRLDKLSKAVKFAREEANEQEADDKEVGAAIMNYIMDN